MKIEIRLDSKYVEPKVIIYTQEMNKEISDIADILSKKIKSIHAFKDEEMYILKESEIQNIYTENGKVYIQTESDNFLSKKRLYELEEILSKDKFVRISNSEIVNFDKIKNLNLKFSGTICINFINGYSTYVSRRYIKKIKEFLEI